jgi:hypothetical protein
MDSPCTGKLLGGSVVQVNRYQAESPIFVPGMIILSL